MNVVLVDMDSTLTEARQKITPPMLLKLRQLSQYAKIGIVSGSAYEYMKEQVGNDILGDPDLAENVYLMPCNGTQLYVYDKPGHNKLPSQPAWICSKSVTMKDKLGDKVFNLVLKTCILTLTKQIEFLDIPYTGHFISNRGSLINLCPIGRNATLDERQTFERLDSVFKIREAIKLSLDDQFKGLNIAVGLGGTTSVDIYPIGWDKTYSLTHYPKDSKFWFIGDRCFDGGNDWEIYKLLQENNTSFQTSGPRQTIKLIDKIIKQIK